MISFFRLFESWVSPFRNPPDLPVAKNGFELLFFFVKQVKWPFLVVLILGCCTALIEVSIFSFVGEIVDLLSEGARSSFLTTHFYTLSGMGLVLVLLRPLVAFLSALIEEQVIVPGFYNLVRWQSHQELMKQSLGFFQDDFSGRLSAKVWQSGQAAGDFLVTLLQTTWYITVYALATLLLIGHMDWRLGALVCVWLGLFSVLSYFFVPRVRAAAKRVANGASGVSGHLVDTYTNIQTVKLFGSTSDENRSLRSAFDRYLERLTSFTRLLTSVRTLMAMMGGTMMGAIAFLALWLWQGGQITTGEVAFALSLILRLNLLLGRLMSQLNNLFRSFGSFQDSMETVIKPVAVTDIENAQELGRVSGRIVFRNVSFHYGKANGIIEDFSLDVKAGERIGLVGPSGAGKSTLVNLLLRFYDVEAGEVLIDDRDVRSVTQQSLRNAVGLVTQDTSLMHRSVGDNILYGRPDASHDQLIAALKKAQALSFVEGLVDKAGRRGLEAHVGERGVKLSGGQRQRLAIARVLLKDAPILVLDEATSALDSEIEAAIQENLAALMQDKTVLAIAHRLSTIAHMDRLVVLDQGRIVQQGTHSDLLKQPEGLYARLWRRQSDGFLDFSSGAKSS
ncbi:MAG: ABC transporter ATP-binding protein [Rhodobacteraceae bacterium]|nr:ABC transporter ATP-binding protein [Paracoccaceae bacterium]